MEETGRFPQYNGVDCLFIGEGKWARAFRPHHTDHRHWGPFFEEGPANASTPADLSTGGVYALAVPAGQALNLDCRVAMLQDKLVGLVTHVT